MASANPLYPLLLNSFRPIYRHLTGQFFAIAGVAAVVLAYHPEILAAVRRRSPQAAGRAMGRMLDHGRQRLEAVIAATKGGSP